MAPHNQDEIVDYLRHASAGGSAQAHKTKKDTKPHASSKAPASGSTKGLARRHTRDERLLLALLRLLAGQHR